MSTLTTILSSLGTGVSTTLGTLDDNGEIDKQKRNSALISTAVSSSLLYGANALNNYQVEKIYEKYSSSYIDSMSDEELAKAAERLDAMSEEKLAQALEKANLLTAESTENNQTKTI